MRITRSLNIENVDVPSPIKAKLLELGGNISFQRQSRKGSNGWLFFGVNKISRQPVAVKFYDWGGDQTYHAEPRHLAAIASENVIQILDASHVDGNYAYFLTPYYRNGDLDEELCRGNYGNIKSINFVRDILSGLSHLHAASLLHRDLKPQNILVSDVRRAVIGDFGSVKKIPEGRDSVPGSGHSIIYRPPESVVSGLYAIPGDIYQVGMVLFQLLGGSLPYEESAWLNVKELATYRSIADGVDRQIYANDRIKEKIRRGTVVNIATLPP
jgi:serine/threonine protein kinase